MVDLEDNHSGGDHKTSFDVSSVTCSICLDLVTDNQDRSIAKLQCGHEFHLDCIGSAFNVKGAMQCPNCRKVERGRWLYASGSTRICEFSVEDFVPDEDPYELGYSEMPFRIHWCPFSGLVRVQPSFEEVESPPTTYHNLQRHHAMYAEHAAASSLAHSYVAYFGPIPPVSSNTRESIEGPNFNHRWNSMSGPNEIFTSHTFPVIDIQYWGPHSHAFSANGGHINSTEQASVPPATLRSTRGEYDAILRHGSFMHPFLHGHSRSQERIQAAHAIHHPQQPRNPPGVPTPMIPGVRRFSGPRGLPPAVPAASQSDQSGGFFIFPPPGSSGRNLHETESPLLNHAHVQQRDHLPHLQVISFDRDNGRSSLHHAGGVPDSGNRSGNRWHRHWS